MVHKNEAAVASPHINRKIGLVYLADSDPEMGKRTWRMVMNDIIKDKHGPTLVRYVTALKDPDYALIEGKLLVETLPADFMEVVRVGNTSTNVYLRRFQNHAVDMDWSTKRVLTKKKFPKIVYGEQRAITWEDHCKIIGRERNPKISGEPAHSPSWGHACPNIKIFARRRFLLDDLPGDRARIPKVEAPEVETAFCTWLSGCCLHYFRVRPLFRKFFRRSDPGKNPSFFIGIRVGPAGGEHGDLSGVRAGQFELPAKRATDFLRKKGNLAFVIFLIIIEPVAPDASPGHAFNFGNFNDRIISGWLTVMFEIIMAG